MRKRLLSLLSITAALFLTTAASSAAEDAPAAVHKKTLWHQIVEGGWIMFPLGACSIFTLYLIADGIVRTSPKKMVPKDHLDSMKNMFRQGDYVGAYEFCRSNPSPFTNVLRVGLSLLGEGKTVTEEGMLGELSKENGRLQSWINYLSVIGVCTPMIGLVGTVTGMMKAFSTLSSSGIGDPSSLSGAIGEVLVATAAGLFVAIPAFAAYYFLRTRAASGIHHLQDSIHTLFRKMPYEALAGVHISDDELYASQPYWTRSEAGGEGVSEPATT